LYGLELRELKTEIWKSWLCGCSWDVEERKEGQRAGCKVGDQEAMETQLSIEGNRYAHLCSIAHKRIFYNTEKLRHNRYL
jgi:hypothetical protein